ncbi:replication initiator [Actinopolymorpha pittospori]
MTRLGKLTPVLIREGAIKAGVCVRPIVRELVDTHTGESTLVPIPCGSTLASKCPPCADKARRLRIQQCREGWHLEHEPPRPEPNDQDDDTDNEDQADEDDQDEEQQRRVRSTRRRDDVPDLPRLKVEERTVGRAFTASDGKVWRPSMFVTFTMDSYGRVHRDGTPVDPESYDYRRAALDALHLSKLWDRLIQNLRRAVGYEVQYFAALEPQKRLAPHLHAAIRGAIPRKILRKVIAGTYASVWWPPHDKVVYGGDHVPVWDELAGGYVDPDTTEPLPTWKQALDALDADEEAQPAHVVRFGKQTDMQGFVAGTAKTDRAIGYLTKYLTKAINDPLDGDEDQDVSPARAAHIDRLHAQVRRLPCSKRCWNWLAYGIQPKDARDGMRPGQCPAKAHDREHLGCGGRRVLVSRYWTGKTLTQHKADRMGAVRAVLEAAGIDPEDTSRRSATVVDEDGQPRYLWHALDLDHLPTYASVIARTIAERNQWRHQYEEAKQRAGPTPSNSATDHAA